MPISIQEVWLRAYCSALSNPSFFGGFVDCVAFADEAVKDFQKRFPSFQFVSNESKQ